MYLLQPLHGVNDLLVELLFSIINKSNLFFFKPQSNVCGHIKFMLLEYEICISLVSGKTIGVVSNRQTLPTHGQMGNGINNSIPCLMPLVCFHRATWNVLYFTMRKTFPFFLTFFLCSTTVKATESKLCKHLFLNRSALFHQSHQVFPLFQQKVRNIKDW